MKVRVVSDLPNEFQGKRGLVKTQVLSCLDMCDSGARLRNTFDYEMSETEKAAYAGRLMDKVIVLDVTEFAPAPFGGRLRARGLIHEAPEKAGK
jgi:hypothetical protein